jgi:hypothetical protein
MGVINPNTKTSKEHIVSGTIALDGSNPTSVVTGLSTITSATVSRNDASAPGADPTALSWAATGGTLNIYAWKITAADNGALIASTNTDVVSYIVTGY